MRLLLASGISLMLFSSCQSSKNLHQKSTETKDTTMAPENKMGLENTLTDQEKKDGWKVLFDGTTKNGWHIYNNKTDGSAWKIDNGTLHLEPSKGEDFQSSGGGDIVTDQEFDNFDFKLEWKIDTGGNSGIMIYVKEDPKYEYTFHTGPEMQVLDNARHDDAKIDKHRAGDLYDLISSSPQTVKPAGEWNLVEIIANKGSLEFHLNGTKVLSTTMWDDNWKKMIAGSKFKEWPAFGTFKSGRIALQDHGNKVWYRNIKIKKL